MNNILKKRLPMLISFMLMCVAVKMGFVPQHSHTTQDSMKIEKKIKNSTTTISCMICLIFRENF